eukprot:g124.t1
MVECVGDMDRHIGDIDELSLQQMRIAFCRILSKTLNKTDVKLTMNGFRDLIRLVLQWTERCLDSSQLPVLTIESITAMSAILSSYKSPISAQMQRNLSMALSTVIIKCRYQPYRLVNPQDSKAPEDILLLCLASSDALQNLFSSRIDIIPEYISGALEAIVNFLQNCHVMEDNLASKMYASLLRTLTTLVSEGNETHANQASSLMELIPVLLQYGVNNTPSFSTPYSDSASGLSSDGTDSGSSRYVPPHQRFSPTIGDYSSTSSCTFSGSEISFSSSVHDRFRSSRVRAAALAFVQKICQVDGKSVHRYWTNLLPLRQPLQRSPSKPHLINVLLYDPHPQVRIASATTISTLMEGKSQKGFISIAEVSEENTSTIRGFNTLSTSLGRMLLSLHEGLLHAIDNEPKLVVIPPLFRCLSSLISSTPYDRMPSDLRLRIIIGIRKRWASFHGTDNVDVAMETSALIALRTVFGTISSDSEILSFLSQNGPMISEKTKLSEQVQEFLLNRSSPDAGQSLLDELLSVAYSDKAIVKSEALAALTSASLRKPSLFKGRWPDMRRILHQNIKYMNYEHSSPEEKANQQAIKFLGAQMTTVPETNEQKEHLEEAIDLASLYLVPSIFHSSAVVRSATLTEIGGASKQFLEMLPEAVFSDLIDGALRSAMEDPVAAVKSAACRMIGDLVNFGFFLTEQEQFGEVIRALRSCLMCRTISVRISSSWSLANVADAIATSIKIPDDLIPIESIAEAAIAASKDHEKVRANGIRALGHLLKKSNTTTSTLDWLPLAVSCLRDSLSNGGAKVKWNACYAVGSLASNSSLRERVIMDETILPSLLQLLVHLIDENPNFKVQMQAASAIDHFKEKSYFQETFFVAISVVSRRLQVLRGGSRMATMDQNEVASTSPNDELIQPVLEPSFANFKYHEALKEQLEATLLHLLSLLDGPCFEFCTFLKPDVLFAWLKRRVDQNEISPVHKRLLISVLENLKRYEGGCQDWEGLIKRLVNLLG